MSKDDGLVMLWESLRGGEGARLVQQADDALRLGPITPALITSLRREHAPDLVAVAIALVIARRACEAKFPAAIASTIMADPEAAQQASSWRAAHHKASRFAAVGANRIVDLCCGIGGDLLALRTVGEAMGVERDALRAWMARVNTGAEVREEDVTKGDWSGAFVHIDPARRVVRGGTMRRVHELDESEPGRAFIEILLRSAAGASVKLGPGADLDSLPGAAETEIEIIGESHGLTQAVLWSGALALQRGWRRATVLANDPLRSRSIALEPDAPCAGETEALARGGAPDAILVPEPALERAGLSRRLAREIGARELAPGLGIFDMPQGRDAGPWFSAHAVQAMMPWRTRAVKSWLAAHDGGIVTVRTRGRAVDPDVAQAELRGAGSTGWTVFILRIGDEKRAIITSS